MIDTLMAVADWWLSTLLLGGGLLLFVRVVLPLVPQPADRQRVAECGVAAAVVLAMLRLFPGWLVLPTLATPAVVAPPPVEPPTMWAWEVPAEVMDTPPSALPAEPTMPPHVPAVGWNPRALLAPAGGALFAVAAVTLAGRWLLGQWGLTRLRRRSRPARRGVADLFMELATALQPSAGLRVSARLPSPVCFGLAKPTVLIPEPLEAADGSTLRYVFAHELAHLRRGDAWSRGGLAVAALVYWPLPWFWGIGKQVRLCQEYVADAVAADAGEAADEYAETLMRLAHAGPALAGALGVMGSKSELFRRVQMLTQTDRPIRRGAARRWTLLAGLSLVAGAVTLSGMGAHAEPPKSDAKRDVPIEVGEGDTPAQVRVFAFPAGAGDPDAAAAIKKLQEKLAALREAQARDVAKLAEQIAAEAAKLNAAGVAKLNSETELQKARQRALAAADGMAAAQNRLFAVASRRPGSHPRLGATIEPASAALADQLDLPKGQGMVLTAILPDSAASKAGFKANDIVLELDGKPVSSDTQKFLDQLNAVKAGAKADAVVLRKGKKETVSAIVLPEAPKGDRVWMWDGATGEQPVRVPLVPAAPLPPMPPLPPQPTIAPLPPGGQNPLYNALAGTYLAAPAPSGFRLSITDDAVEATQKDASGTIQVRGTLKDGKLAVGRVSVSDAEMSISVDGIDKLPAQWRSKVQALQEKVAAKLGGKGDKKLDERYEIEIRTEKREKAPKKAEPKKDAEKPASNNATQGIQSRIIKSYRC